MSVDYNPRFGPTIMADVLEWDYAGAFPPGHFDVVFACPPCEQFSRARTTKVRDLASAEDIVVRTLKIIRYFKPRLWFLENPRQSLLRTLPCMTGIPHVDIDYCQFSSWADDWGYRKQTRFWGGPHVATLKDHVCDPATCPNTVERDGRWVHREKLGGKRMRFGRNKKYRIPEGAIRYLCGFPDPEVVRQVTQQLSRMGIHAVPQVHFLGEGDLQDQHEETAKAIVEQGQSPAFSRGVVLSENPLAGPEAEALRQRFLEEYKDSVFNTKVKGPPPVRGPFGEATITLKPGAVPRKQRMYQIQGDRRAKWDDKIRRFEEEMHWLEDGVSPWSSPSFPVPKKKPGEIRVVVDYREVNDATITDAHPLPRIADILTRQGKYRIWSVLDMKDGYHPRGAPQGRPAHHLHVHASRYQTVDRVGDGAQECRCHLPEDDGVGDEGAGRRRCVHRRRHHWLDRGHHGGAAGKPRA